MEDWDIIYSYSREQAIQDGILIDCSSLAKELGYVFPVAITDTLWQMHINKEFNGQSATGRLWDVLNVLRWQIKVIKQESSILLFEVYFRQEDGSQELIKLKAHVGPGNSGEGVLTIMLPNED